ncbi:MAG: hypothetical protein KBA05_04430, partial [Anaerolineaceae bacterium]|nr:hypothetical protein [Anaerolineaceae bacterium]
SMLIVILMGTTFVIGSSFLFSSTKLYWNFLFFSIHGLLKRILKKSAFPQFAAICVQLLSKIWTNNTFLREIERTPTQDGRIEGHHQKLLQPKLPAGMGAA